jgi:bifunctional non-homologous end joining protein LigD
MPHTDAHAMRDELWFADADVHKSDVLYYYRRAAEHVVPHVRGRIVAVDWLEDGLDGKCLECPGALGLIGFTRRGALALHTSLCRVDRIDNPDRVVFDLDGDDFEAVRGAAQELRTVLEELGLPSWPMLTGSRGLHVLVPLDRKGTFEQSEAFARGVAAWMASRVPVVVGEAGEGQVGIVIERNAPEGRHVVPYGVRRTGAVAVPVAWEELDKRGVHAKKFDLWTALERLDRHGDPWAGIGRRGRSLKMPLKRLAKRGYELEILAAK